MGYFSLYSNTTGGANTANGESALGGNTTGVENTATGYQALSSNTTGSDNSAFGYGSGPNSSALNNTTALGLFATTTASNQVRIGNSSVTSIGGQVGWSTLSDGRFKRDVKEDVLGLEFIKKLRPISYFVDTDQLNNFLGVSDKFPDKLKRQSRTENESVRQTGFIAQEVEAIIKKTGFSFSGIEAPQNENDHYSIRYADFVVPLPFKNSVLK